MIDTDLVKSILSVIGASIPLIVAIIALIRSRAYGTVVPNDIPSLKVLKIKREPVDQKAWKQYRFEQIMTGILWTIPGYIIYSFVIFYTSGQIKNSFVVVIITCTFGVAYIFVSYLISKMLFLDYLFAIKDAYNGRYLIFKSIYVEVEADYYYLFNKCHEAFKSMSYPVIEIDADSGVLERRSRNGKDEIDRKSQRWLAQEKRPYQEEEDATIALATTSRAIRARRADCEEDSESQVVCVFAPAQT